MFPPVCSTKEAYAMRRLLESLRTANATGTEPSPELVAQIAAHPQGRIVAKDGYGVVIL
jgi:hypothetical protein